jgi:hypothetical protein
MAGAYRVHSQRTPTLDFDFLFIIKLLDAGKDKTFPV